MVLRALNALQNIFILNNLVVKFYLLLYKKELNDHTERFDSIKNDIKKSGAKIDGKLIPTSEALLDGYKDNAEHITIIDDKVDRLQIDVNTISMKVSYNDSRITEMSKDFKKAK